MSPAETIALVGEALYGSRWQTDLANALCVSDRTMRRWAAGSEVPRVDIMADLRKLVLARGEWLQEVDRRLMSVPLAGFRATGTKAA